MEMFSSGSVFYGIIKNINKELERQCVNKEHLLLLQRTRLSSQQQHSGSQLSTTSLPGDLMPSFDLLGR